MLTYQPGELPLIPTQVIGSAGVPGWMWIVRDAVAAGKMGPSDIDEALKDAVSLAIMDMEEAGVDIISDGEMQRADFTWHFHGKVKGLAAGRVRRASWAIPAPTNSTRSVVVEPLTVPDGYGHAGGIPLRPHAHRPSPLISPIQSPLTQAFRIDPGEVYKNKSEVAWALVPYINQELKDVVAAGCTHIQFDEPAYWIAARRPRGDGRDLQRLRRGRRGDHRLPPLLRQLPRPARHLASQLRRLRALLQGSRTSTSSTSSSPTARCTRSSCGRSMAATRSCARA